MPRLLLERSERIISGIQSIAWRTRWERTCDEFCKAKLIQYNMEDCHALRRVVEFLGDTLSVGRRPPDGITPWVANVAELDELARTVKWSKFAQPDFDFINKRAFFDYQRTHVFARTSPAPRRRNKRVQKRTRRNRKIRVTHRVKITASKCPFCNSPTLVPISEKQRPKEVQTRVKRAYDIEVTAGAIKRKVVEIRAVPYRCSNCHRCFVSDRYHRLAKHFHGFMSWFAYQQITHRLGGETLAALFDEVFGIQVVPTELLAFRNLLARYYRKTYQGLLKRIIAGPVLYIDETEIKLKTGTAYVWVLASSEATVYIYRTSREGEFLRKLLKGFSGVLVSDFYSAYDGLDCIQQRCLIHLMRDMNRAILENTFDQELQSITTPFGVLLRSIVTTVDEHGLKRRYLVRHSGAVKSFFDTLSDRVYETDASKALQERLLKTRDRLFTFIHHDGVSWNNNLAENAIKRIGYYREDVGRAIKETGIIEQLVLLSVYQTFRVRDMSFLRFLLSKERNIDAFSSHKHPPRRGLKIELYPKGYTPPFLISLRPGKRSKMRVAGATVLS